MKNQAKIWMLSVLICLLFLNVQGISKDKKPIRILLLSGRNNHEWQQTTPYIEKMFLQSGVFTVSVTEKPDTLKSVDFEKFDVVLSNWNSWPENDLRWPAETEKALLEFIKNGGGLVTFHASSSAFYKWPEFQEISTAAWIMDTTSHGKPSETHVSIINKKHPVTAGISDFIIFDELWLNAAVNPKFEVLGTASNQKTDEESIKSQPAILVAGYGKGRIFHTILGHNVKAMESEGFQTLLLRGTEWAATGKVSQKDSKKNKSK
jgi:type 1 glutamine amidotransferase